MSNRWCKMHRACARCSGGLRVRRRLLRNMSLIWRIMRKACPNRGPVRFVVSVSKAGSRGDLRLPKRWQRDHSRAFGNFGMEKRNEAIARNPVVEWFGDVPRRKSNARHLAGIVMSFGCRVGRRFSSVGVALRSSYCCGNVP
jgi:hypothetical protein